ncbi:carbonic anhydrase [Paeniroseomonas aquatica]|uniref:carbonic anhydrase n=1 Tax=Paeniroseomonas aquatica TaxID=373043 RepID=A0ABT8A6N6_9PROT|nr:carbonic anhydrase [Paeniroseomonas aquatica]MDN3565464.1 carbonic anhydrase [Paeniroseomonas aquatica]
MPDASCRCCGSAHPHPPAQDRPAGQGWGRRRFAAAGLLAATAALAPASGRTAEVVARTSLTPDQALRQLQDGNDRFLTEAPFRSTQGRERRVELARGQAPFAVLVGCSDSRVPPELLFGRGLGELFIVRNAGNTIDTAALGSVEYGVGVLGCPLVVVLGHEGCGAVAAALDVVERNAVFPGVIGEMVQPIIPAVLSVRGAAGDPLDNAVRANARRVATRLATQSGILRDAVAAGRLRIVAARYDLDDGDVDWLDAG